MSVTLKKCGNGCKDKRPADFRGEFKNFGESVCDWCAGMWGHDDNQWEELKRLRESLCGDPELYPKEVRGY